MSFNIKKTKNKKETTYKSLYIDLELAEWLEEYASKNDTSFNNLVISMIESCKEDITKNNKIS